MRPRRRGRRAARRHRAPPRMRPPRPSSASRASSRARGATTSRTQAGVTSASSTRRPPPGRDGRGRVEPLLAVADRQRHVDGRQPDGGELAHRVGPRARHDEVGRGVGEVHPVAVLEHDVGRRRSPARRRSPCPCRPRAAPARPPPTARPAAAAKASLSRWAPSDPPVTSRVGASVSPNRSRASARRAGRSSIAISRRSGIPVRVACGSRVPGKVMPTPAAKRAPSRLASPGRAFCSWTTTGVPRRRAAR